MLDNKLCLISVVEFLRRRRVDHGSGTREGKVVVGTDLSKRKVVLWYLLCIYLSRYAH